MPGCFFYAQAYTGVIHYKRRVLCSASAQPRKMPFWGREEKMNTGKIKKIVRERGFGFIDDTDGREVFFHQNALSEVKFEDLSEGQTVSYDVEKSDKGPRALNLRAA